MDHIIRSRATQKVLAPQPWAPTLSPEEQRALADELLALAAAAPYHYASAERYRSSLSSALPFRFRILSTERCRETADYIAEQEVPAGKVQNMLWAADLLMLVTWLPDVFGTQATEEAMREPIPFTGNLRNMEHIAATSAAIQNVLLGATQRGIPNYWSSGGMLRFDPVRSYLGLPQGEILLGALFLFPKDSADRDAVIAPGKMRDEGKDPASWSEWV